MKVLYYLFLRAFPTLATAPARFRLAPLIFKSLSDSPKLAFSNFSTPAYGVVS